MATTTDNPDAHPRRLPRTPRTAQLHTAAAWYPDNPTEQDKTAGRNLISSLAAMYPCLHCAEDFRSTVRDDPPRCVVPCIRLSPPMSSLTPLLPYHIISLQAELKSRVCYLDVHAAQSCEYEIGQGKGRNEMRFVCVLGEQEEMDPRAISLPPDTRRLSPHVWCRRVLGKRNAEAALRLFPGETRREMARRATIVLLYGGRRQCARVPRKGLMRRRQRRRLGRYLPWSWWPGW